MKTDDRGRCWYALAAALLGSLGSACTGQIGGGPPGAGNSSTGPGDSTGGIGGGGAGGATAATGSGVSTGATGGGSMGTTGTCIAGCSNSTGGDGAGTSAGTCTPSTAIGARLARLDNNKLANSIKAVLGSNVLTTPKKLDLPPDTGDPKLRLFDPLLTEIETYSADSFSPTVDLIEGAIGNLAVTDIQTLLGCNGSLTDACVTEGLPKLAARANRVGTIDPDEQTTLVGLYTSLKTAGSTIEEATRYAIEGLMLAPESLYRTEFGQAAVGKTSISLTPYELESEIAYFLTDGPPDATGLANAPDIATPDGLTAEVDRILALPSTIDNLNQVMGAYWGLGNISQVIKSATDFPNFTQGVRADMYTEANTFLVNTLAGPKLTDLLTSPTTYLNTELATYYGVPAPAGATLTNFVPFTFPATEPRQGILSKGGILAMRGRPTALDVTVVSRGLYVNSSVLCLQKPPDPPASVKAQVTAQLMDSTQNELQKADYRAATSPCNACHAAFDPYGRALLNFDNAGAYISKFPDGTTIDASTKLPAAAGGANVENAVDMENQVSQSGLFTACVASNLLKFAYMQASPNVTAADCIVSDLNKQFQKTDQSFRSMVRTIALSSALSIRSVQ